MYIPKYLFSYILIGVREGKSLWGGKKFVSIVPELSNCFSCKLWGGGKEGEGGGDDEKNFGMYYNLL